MIIDKFHISLFNILSELIYIYDYNTSEVLFLNNKAKQILKINNNIPLKYDIKKSPFFDNDVTLNKNINSENNFINYESCSYNINKTISTYNKNKVMLCVCTEIKDSIYENENKRLEMQDILINVISILGKDEKFFKIMYEILEMIGLYYNADRCYVNEHLTNNEKCFYFYEWNRLNSRDNVCDEFTNDEETINWINILQNKEILFIDNISYIKDKYPEKYRELMKRNIKNIIVAIMYFSEKPIGFMCIENIEENQKDLSLLKSIIYFSLNEFRRRQVSKKLTFMSFHDASTGLYNRNKYINYIDNVKYNRLRSVGIAFIDINGLKKINDTQGHQFGDRAIKEVSLALKKFFRKEDSYRIGGDEFVIISENITKDAFKGKVNQINRYFLNLMEYSISIGYLWRDKNLDIRDLSHKADEYMYKAKSEYYNYIKEHNVVIYSSMATESEEDDGTLKIVLGHDTELDFSTNKSSLQSRQDIFKFKVKQLMNNNKKLFAMVMLDINNFKVINEMYGFDEGNKILIKINQIINKFIFGRGLCYHSYSDIYYFCCEAKDDEHMIQIINNISNEINEMIENIKIVLSYGVCRMFEDEQNKNIDIDDIIKCASYAHKISKRDSTKNIIFYDEQLRQTMLNEKEIENDMDEALINNEFKLYLQPKYNIHANKINGAEALVRWEHNTKGLMFPGSFIPIFEKNGFIIKLDMYILEQVCKFIKDNEKKGRTNVPISVNISKLNFRSKNLKKHVMDIINKYGINPNLIELEITESLMAEKPKELIKVIEDFKKERVIISMDDFGTGYSSLSILQILPVDVLKIDCGFFKNFEKSKKGRTIIKSIVMLSKELEIDVIAEGIETKEEVEYLKDIDCNNVQGYYFSKPITLEEFEKLAFHNN